MNIPKKFKKANDLYVRVKDEYNKHPQEMSKKLFALRDKKTIYGFEPNILIAEYMEAWKQNNEDVKFSVFEKVEEGFDKIVLQQNKDNIIKFLKCNNEEIKTILNQIKTPEEADIVFEALYGTKHITLLPKGYSKAKTVKSENKKRAKSTKKRIPIIGTYERALRRNRHMVEEYLQELGVGRQRAKKISQILQYL